MSQHRANPEAEFHPIIAGRWSPRAFDSRAVEAEKLTSCLEAARWSSSCFGDEPWRLIVADRSNNEDGWNRLLATLVEKNQRWAKQAPVLILACASDNFSRNGNPNRWSQYDTGQAMMSLTLQATAEGLVAHPMGGFDPAAAKAAFDIPADVTPLSVTALGYAGDADTLDEAFKPMELARRSRKPLHEIALASWNHGWQA
ncbi:MAG: nitroreductase [Zetaproteobacteria bacterium CG02_land_8_20_14_3_00_50_9]|nr:MAG: nitroreductase [Zetaproteobacteria bacterium CG17_big_fil_post_rev_8_21_14_2_50_50_13]PIV30466.1 MAG: nitroreductase [Zetaproteobacteria bacterium CG02_land_8_20_14_3_00_50_9]PIY54888.1 MAG: nitroreductase [Zetaproteobacteria bacterium CG_4_10_14_0_8_um_filter_49_80]